MTDTDLTIEMPRRIQRMRTKGYKLPVGAKYVGRPTWFGNPFAIEDGFSHEQAVQFYRAWLTNKPWVYKDVVSEQLYSWLEFCREGRLARLNELKGRDLACFCSLDKPCHADVLLKLANASEYSNIVATTDNSK